MWKPASLNWSAPQKRPSWGREINARLKERLDHGQVMETKEIILGATAKRNGSAWRARLWPRPSGRNAYR